MSGDGPMLTSRPRVALVDLSTEHRLPDVRTRATRDRALIEQWAKRRGAEPATGEGTSSGGRAALEVKDGDAGIRFNFPGFARFRPISWAEWFDNFERFDLTFVFEIDEDGQPLISRWRLRPTAELTDSVVLV
jgi:hypothetical protein